MKSRLRDTADETSKAFCQAKNKKGERCGSRAKPGSPYCGVHPDYVPEDHIPTAMTAVPRSDLLDLVANFKQRHPDQAVLLFL